MTILSCFKNMQYCERQALMKSLFALLIEAKGDKDVAYGNILMLYDVS